MCAANKRFFIYLFLALLFVSIAGALRAQEPEPWYLISEMELRSIEAYKATSEQEKQTWLSQVQRLRTQAESLRRESESLNIQLSNQRSLNRSLTELFNRYEQEQLTLLSLKNGEIADLKQVVADKTLETEVYKRKAALRLIGIISLCIAIAGYVAFRVMRFLRVIPI